MMSKTSEVEHVQLQLCEAMSLSMLAVVITHASIFSDSIYLDANDIAVKINDIYGNFCPSFYIDEVLFLHALHRHWAFVESHFLFKVDRRKTTMSPIPAVLSFPKVNFTYAVSFPVRHPSNTFSSVNIVANTDRANTILQKLIISKYGKRHVTVAGSPVSLSTCCHPLLVCRQLHQSASPVAPALPVATLTPSSTHLTTTTVNTMNSIVSVPVTPLLDASGGSRRRRTGNGLEGTAVGSSGADKSQVLTTGSIPQDSSDSINNTSNSQANNINDAIDGPRMEVAVTSPGSNNGNSGGTSDSSGSSNSIVSIVTLCNDLQLNKNNSVSYTGSENASNTNGDNNYTSVTERTSITTNTEEIQISASRQRILNSSLTYGANTSTYCVELKSNKQHTSDYYIKNGIPGFPTRLQTVQSAMPDLYHAIFNALISKRHQADSAAHLKKASRYSTDGNSELEDILHANAELNLRAEHVQSVALELCEVVAGAQAGGSVSTPARVSNGVLLYLGNTTKRVMDEMCSKEISIGYNSAKHIVNGWLVEKQNKIQSAFNAVEGNDTYMTIHVFDNYVVCQYGTRKISDVAFTHQASTVAALCTFVRKRAPIASPPAPIFKPFSFSHLVEILMGPGIIVPVEFQEVTDEKVKYQGLRNYNVQASLDARSSSYLDTEKKVIDGMLIEKAHMNNTVNAVLVDTEFINSFYRYAYCNEEKMQNMMLLPPIFHIQMHILQNLTADPVNYLLVWAPYQYGALKMQKAKVREKVNIIFEKMKKLVTTFSGSGSGSDNSGGGNSTHTSGDTSDSNNNVDATAPCSADSEKVGSGQPFFAAAVRDLQETLLVSEVEKDNDEEEEDEDDDDEEAEENETEGEQGGRTYAAAGAAAAPIGTGGGATRDEDLYSDAELKDVLVVAKLFLEQLHRNKCTLFSFREKQAMQMQFKRNKFGAQQLVASFRTVNHLPQCWATRFVGDVILKGFGDLGLDWAADIIERGRAQPFLEKLHTVTQYIAYCGREKIVRSLMVVAGSVLRAKEQRPDCFEVYVKDCTLINDVNVENSNSCTQRCLPGNCLCTPAIVSRAAQLSGCKRDFLPRKVTKKEHRGEIFEEEVKYKRPNGKADQTKIAGFMTRYMQRLERISSPDPPTTVATSEWSPSERPATTPAAPAATPNSSTSSTDNDSPPAPPRNTEPARVCPQALYTTSDCCRHGAERLQKVIAPNFEKYLHKERRKSDRNNQRVQQQQQQQQLQEPQQLTEEYKRDDAYLRQFSKSALEAFLRSISVPCSKYNIDGFVKYICETRQREQFSQFIVTNKIYNNEDAKTYVENKKKSRKKIVRQQQQQLQHDQQGSEDELDEII